MNIVIRELKANYKAFILWIIGLSSMSLLGMMKFQGLSADAAMMDKVIKSFPKIMLALFGMSDLDMGTLAGYYLILLVYIMIIGGLYAVYLGIKVTSFDINEKTSDFLYSKPVSRNYIILMKQLTAIFYITLFCIANYLFVVWGIALIKDPYTIDQVNIMSNIGLWLVMVLYFALGNLIGSFKASKAGAYANIIFLFTYMMAVFSDMVEKSWYLKMFSPFKYFDTKLLLKHQLDIKVIIVTLVMTLILFVTTHFIMKRKDL